MSNHADSGSPAVKILSVLAALGLGFFLLGTFGGSGAQGFFEMCRGIAMGVDQLTKPILILVVIAGLAKLFFMSKSGNGDSKAPASKPSGGGDAHH